MNALGRVTLQGPESCSHRWGWDPNPERVCVGFTVLSLTWAGDVVQWVKPLPRDACTPCQSAWDPVPPLFPIQFPHSRRQQIMT